MALKEPNSNAGSDRNSFNTLSVDVIFGMCPSLKSLGSALMKGVPGNKELIILKASTVSLVQQFDLSVHIH